ncbi:hypothetical protein ACP70R_016611 [Stipagrostis hirtigluma subsp. patula]
MGHCVARLTLAGLSARVVTLGVAFFMAPEALDVGKNIGTVSDDALARRMFLVLPVAALNTVFIYGIFSSLSKTLNKLKSFLNDELQEALRQVWQQLQEVIPSHNILCLMEVQLLFSYGSTHPVRTHFLEDILEKSGYKLTSSNQLDDYGQDKVWKFRGSYYLEKGTDK